MAEEEDKLILQAVEGDPGAFGALYDRYHPQIYRFIYLKIGRREESEDLTHQDIIILRFVEELSVKEAAKALGRSEGAAKLLQHRAMRELQKHLQQPAEALGDPELTTEQPWK